LFLGVAVSDYDDDGWPRLEAAVLPAPEEPDLEPHE
jgi:hypothetical protein